jgi:hypothetical protein
MGYRKHEDNMDRPPYSLLVLYSRIRWIALPMLPVVRNTGLSALEKHLSEPRPLAPR